MRKLPEKESSKKLSKGKTAEKQAKRPRMIIKKGERELAEDELARVTGGVTLPWCGTSCRSLKG
jgi:hypothetical protein